MLSKLPDNVLAHTTNFIKNIYTKLDGISFVTSKLSQSQLSLTLLSNIVPFIEKFPYTEISIYNMRNELPILTPHCAVYNVKDIPSHIGALIATDPNAFAATRLAQDATIFYYIHDVQILRFIPPKDLEYLKASNAILFTRSPEHQKFLKKEFGLDTISQTVPDFELDLIYKIVKENS